MSKFHITTIAAAGLGGASIYCLEGAPRWIVLGAGVLVWIVATLLGVFVLRLGYFCRVYTGASGPSDGVALTFDDGPDAEATPAVLDLLKSMGVKAAFFCTGKRVEDAPETAKRIVSDGHIVGNHTYSHSNFTNFYTTRGVAREIERCEEAISGATGVRPKLFRPPVGLTNPNVASAARKLGVDVVGWRAGRFDRRAESCEAIAGRILRSLRAGAIIALHDQGVSAERLVGTVKLLIDGIRSKGFRLVPVDELIGRRAYREGAECSDNARA